MLFSKEFLSLLPIIAPALLLSLTVHEFAHARTAQAFGDPTAKLMGRCTLNPLKHLDFMGTAVFLLTGMFGWAKPVPVNPINLRPRRIGDFCVSLAGPLSNLGLAFIAAAILARFPQLLVQGENVPKIQFALGQSLCFFFAANIGLACFNILPFFPLDGHHMLRELLPPDKQMGFMQWQVKFGPLALLAVIFLPGLLSAITHREVMDPLMKFIWFVRNHILDYAIMLFGRT